MTTLQKTKKGAVGIFKAQNMGTSGNGMLSSCLLDIILISLYTSITLLIIHTSIFFLYFI